MLASRSSALSARIHSSHAVAVTPLSLITRFASQSTRRVTNNCTCSATAAIVSSQQQFFRRGFASQHQQQHGNKNTAVKDEARILHSYATLQLTIGADATTIRAQYLTLAKKLHPDMSDSPSSTSTTEEFTRVHEAYLYLTSLHADVLARTKQEAKRRADQGESQYSHSPSSSSGSSGPVPNAANHANLIQNRQYLRNEGVGEGSDPMKRDRQYRTHKWSRGHEAAMDYQNAKIDKLNDASSANAQNTHAKELSQYDSLLFAARAASNKHIPSGTILEEQIKQATKEWDPTLLKDFGKPLSHLDSDSGAVTDPLEAKLNAILRQNGVVPDWLDLEKTIVREYDQSVEELKFVWNELVTEAEYLKGKKKLEVEGDQIEKVVSSSPAYSFPSSSSASSSSSSSSSSIPPLFHSPFGLTWSLALNTYFRSLQHINSRIDDFNVSVPQAAKRGRMYYMFLPEIESIQSRQPDATMAGVYTIRPRVQLGALTMRRGVNGGAGGGTKRSKKVRGTTRLATQVAGGHEHDAPTIRMKDAIDDIPSSTTSTIRPTSTSTSATATSSFTLQQLPEQQRQQQQHQPDLTDLLSASETMTDLEVEDLYRSLSPAPRRVRTDNIDSIRARRQNMPVSPIVIAIMAVSTAALFAVPLWLTARTSAKRKEKSERNGRQDAQIQQEMLASEN